MRDLIFLLFSFYDDSISLTASDLENWACSGEDPNTLLPKVLLWAGGERTDSHSHQTVENLGLEWSEIEEPARYRLDE